VLVPLSARVAMSKVRSTGLLQSGSPADILANGDPQQDDQRYDNHGNHEAAAIRGKIHSG
jgi:CxxC motif-containing protein (DUF1111 family)